MIQVRAHSGKHLRSLIYGKVFVSVLEDELGSRFTAEAKEALVGGFRGLTAAIVKSLK